ncbi:hypothetical protein [Burkholderia pseudomallei]|uniref:hypothetical protein n=1 Tax=Burkholderia pseudomallei TaxID=28450 RepID=UPI00053921C8|nr:hypothetical protein [Burkholderia pseudomallei]KGX18978.1 hypothetical protein X896_792 [Burkholderia pseudomallei ABCPW 1]
MSNDFHYPVITDHVEWSIKMIITLATENAAYLDDEACPYGVDFKKVISNLIHRQVQPEQKKVDIADFEITEDQIDSSLDIDLYRVFADLKNYGKTIPQSDQTERMAYFRTATSLLERLVTARERALGIKQIRDFQDTVLSIMEECMSPDQRTEVMERLRSAINTRRSDDDAASTTTQESSNEN